MPDSSIDFKSVFHAMPGIALLLSPDSPDFTILAVTDELIRFAKIPKGILVGRKLFEIFSENPGDTRTSGVKDLQKSLQEVMATVKPVRLEVLRYDVRNKRGIFEELYWAPLITPVLTDDGSISYILINAENVTEKILSEKEAKATKENFEYYLDQASSPFAILTGRTLEFTFANAAYIQLMNGRQLVGKTLDEAIPELKGQPFVTLLEQVYETGIPFHSSEIAATALFEGNTEPATRYFNLSYTPYKDHDGVTKGIVASGYDITEEVVTRQKIKRQVLNQQAYNLFMQAPVGFSLLTGENHIVELVNETALRITGKTKESMGHPVAEILPEIQSKGYVQFLDRVKQDGESIYLKESKVLLTRNGVEEKIYLNIYFQPYYEEDRIIGILTILTDVTEQVSSRKKIEELKDRFETMANNIPNLAWIANADGWIFWYNSRWFEYTGTTLKEMEGWGWQSVHDPKKLPGVLEQWQQSIQEGQPFEMVFPIKGADKIFRPFLTKIVPVKDSDGKIIRWLGTNTDITRQKEIERMKDDFMSMASHELKTPLTTIKAYTQIAESILEENGDKKTLAMMKRMSTQVNKLNTLIEDLLDVTKMQKGKLPYKDEFFDFNELISEVIDDMQKTSHTHTIKSTLGETSKIFGDRNKIGQVIDNLISNAIKYSPKADSIIVSSGVQNNGVLLSVQDFGIGILAKDRKKIFIQFYRVNDNNQITFPGMGIGLYICSEIINRHEGKIWIESKMGEGSVFNVWLPFDYREIV